MSAEHLTEEAIKLTLRALKICHGHRARAAVMLEIPEYKMAARVQAMLERGLDVPRPFQEPNRPSHEPTPEEIERECEKIRASWSDYEYYRRAGVLEPPAWAMTEAQYERWLKRERQRQ